MSTPTINGRVVSGGHNKVEFDKLIQNGDVEIQNVTDLGNGLTLYDYNVAGKSNIYPKTVYDPNKWTDQQMLNLGQKAAASKWDETIQNIQLDPSKRKFETEINGIKFKGYINIDKGTGQPFIGSVYPVD